MKSRLLILAALIVAASASAEADGGAPRSAPVLSGAYAISGIFNCTTSGGTASQITAEITFDPQAQTASIKGYRADGNPMTLTKFSHSAGAYSNTSTTLTLNGTVYQANYGALKNGIATYVSFLAVDLSQENQLCGDQYWAARE